MTDVLLSPPMVVQPPNNGGGIWSRAHELLDAIVRERYGDNRSQLARELKLSPAAVSRWFCNRRQPSLRVVLDLRTRFGIAPELWQQPSALPPPHVATEPPQEER